MEKRKLRSQRTKVTTRSQSKKAKATSSRFECDSCSKTFAWKKDLYRHERCHEPNTKKFPCPHCERRFIRKDKLSSHLLVHLAGAAKTPPLKSAQCLAHYLYSDKKFKEIKCMICKYEAPNVRELRQHIILHKNLELMEDLADSEVVKRFYTEKDLQEVIPLISGQITMMQFGKFYSIVNAHSYEMGISDSDDSDPETKLQYTCEICNISFNRKHKLMTHQTYDHTIEECPYKCGSCELRFSCEQILEKHRKHHCDNPDREIQCTKCPGRFTWPQNFGDHKCGMNAIEEASTVCEVCSKPFTSSKDHKSNTKTDKSDVRSHDCSVCSEKFVRYESLRRHLKTHTKKDKSLAQKKLQCMLCDAEFQTIRALKCHLFSHSDGKSDIQFKSCEFVKTFYPDADEDFVSERIRKCFDEQRLCQLYMAVNKFGFEMVLNDSDSDDAQEPTEDPSETYICEMCDLKFPRMQAILRHQYVEHDPKKTVFPLKCDKCEEQFVCEPLLRRHTTSECMNSDRIHACPNCGTKFSWRQNLDAHNCLRSAKDPEDNKKCGICGKKFVWLKDLHRHKRSHIPDEKKFECLVCERKFNRKDNMRAHMKVHANDYKVRTKAMLKWEQQDENLCKPHGQKVIQCKICLSKHSSIRDLTTHLMTHNDRKTLKQRDSEVKEISMLLYNKVMDLRTLSKTICRDLANGKHSRFYSITNEVGYELTLIDSETSTDLDADDNDADDDDDDGILKGYNCTLCKKNFDRKFKIFQHQTKEHQWDQLPFECTHCAAKFVSEALYHFHLQYECENREKKFKCRQCPLKFTWKENLKTHEKYIHDKNPVMLKKYQCSSCDKRFLWHKDLLRHTKFHHLREEKFECTWCFRLFMRKDNLKVHMKVHQNATQLLLPDIYYLARPNGTKIAECKHCAQKFPTIFTLLEHIQITHFSYQMPAITPNPSSYSITNALGYEMDIEDSETETEQPAEKYTCELCDARFNRRFKLLQHQQSRHYSDNIPHKCNHCNFKCVSEPIISYHIRTQCKNAAKQFRCSKCTMRFMWQENLENHESLIHDSPRTYTCEVCKRDFATQHDLKTHSNCKPPAEVKLFECDLCDRKYNRKDRLIQHVKVHTDEAKEARAKGSSSTDKKYLCAFCGKEVSSSSNLVIHMRRHTGEKPFKCEFCNKGFPRSSDLSCHRRTHTGERPHKCLVCDKAFSRSYKLQTHMRIHSGERPYKCTYCEKSFTQSNDLTLHVRRHTGERPYICETCGERFIQGTALRNHRRMRGHYEI